MNSLKQTRVDRGIKRKDIANSLGINLSNLSPLESGKQIATALTRKRLELFFGQKINWLDTPFINTSPRYATEWNEVERAFRSLIRMIGGLRADEQKAFIKSALRHLHKLGDSRLTEPDSRRFYAK
jgi:transcriptional regulator with XRE-family HTH domain